MAACPLLSQLFNLCYFLCVLFIFMCFSLDGSSSSVLIVHPVSTMNSSIQNSTIITTGKIKQFLIQSYCQAGKATNIYTSSNNNSAPEKFSIIHSFIHFSVNRIRKVF